MMNYIIIGGVIAAALFIVSQILTMIYLRRVVSTNEVHIVQSSSKTTSYGKDTGNGNVYYAWPTWMPFLGITTTVLPVSNFQLELKSYDAYDKDRLPFEIDVVAFFRIMDSNMAAQKVASIDQLKEQLEYILKGSARTILASYDINQIMVERSKFGDHFTQEVRDQLKNWGVETVKNIELMDIRDAKDSQVIHNIMAKTKSLIEMESRSTVANNMKLAQVAEIEAQREVEMQKQDAAKAVGLRNASREQEVGIAAQQAAQAIREEERTTKEKEMAVTKVAQVQQAEIDRNVQVVKADAAKQTNILNAEASKETMVLVADGNLESSKRAAQGVELQGAAKASAEKALLLAPVQAQITLAKEIGENKNYQEYLVTIRTVEANQAVGIEQAKALTAANIKVIANSGDIVGGVGKISEMFNAKGGTNIGAMLEGLSQTEAGSAVINKFLGGKSNGNGAAHA